MWIDIRNISAPATSSPNQTCVALHPGDRVISRTTFIATATTVAVITSLSLLGVCGVIYARWRRRRASRAARAWGRKSRYDARVSVMKRGVDLSYSEQYRGCLVNAPENPYLRCLSPVELMPAERVWEVPAEPARTAVGRAQRKSRLSVWFDQGRGVWLPKR